MPVLAGDGLRPSASLILRAPPLFTVVVGAASLAEIMIFGLRASDTEQMDGLDFSEHAANAYPDFQTTEQA